MNICLVFISYPHKGRISADILPLLSKYIAAIEFFYNSLFSARSWQNPASIDGKEQNKKKLPPVGIELTTSWSSIQCSTDWAKSLFGCLCELLRLLKSCSINSGNNQSPKCEVVHEAKLTSEISCPTHTWLAQLAEHYSDDQEVVGSMSTKGNYLFSLLCQYWQDSARIWQEMTNYRKTWLSLYM